MKTGAYLAFDLGAASGRAMLGLLSDGGLELHQMHRFDNPVLEQNGRLCWDTAYLNAQLREGLRRTADAGYTDLAGIGVDTWGVDFVLLDKQGRMTGDPVMYRDSRTKGMMDKAFSRISRKDIYRITGTQFMELNTVYQLLSLREAEDPALSRAERLLFMPDYFHYCLTGSMVTEYTIASTSQLLNAEKRTWSRRLLHALGIPGRLLGPVVSPGTAIGPLRKDICRDTGIRTAQVIAPACHDTASAVAAVPAAKEDWAFLSSGTWSLLGISVDGPIITEESLAGNFTNEGGTEGQIRFLSNCMGLWLLQQCRREWEREGGKPVPWEVLAAEAERASAFRSLVDPDNPVFLNPDDMRAAIAACCRDHAQPVPESRGEFCRCILESLALKYSFLLKKINRLRGRNTAVLHIVGGGSKNDLLNQFTANACGIDVIAGPVEATAAGNVIIQAAAAGQLAHPAEGRRLIAASLPLKKYVPENTAAWDEAGRRFAGLPG